MTSWGDTGWTVLAGVGGAISLAMVGAPLSVDMVFLIGPDQAALIGAQFAVLFCGAIATGVAILLARHWRWLLLAGSVGMVVAQAIRVPRLRGIAVQVGRSKPDAVPDISAHPVWVCLLVASAAVLLVGVLGVAQELLRSNRLGACLAGFAGCAGYFGASIVSRLRAIPAPVQFIVVAVVAVITGLAVLRLRAAPGTTVRWASMVAAAAALVWLLPAMMVAIRSEAVFGTVTGGVVGLVVLALAIVASRPTGTPGMLAVGATGLVLAAPLLVLVLVYDVLLIGVWYAWPIAITGVLVGTASAAGPWELRAGIVAAAGLSMVGLAAGQAEKRSTGELVIWLFLALSVAAVATTVGSAAQVLARIEAVPALGALGPLAALGVFGSLNLLRAATSGISSFNNIFGTAANWVSAVLLLAAAGLLLVLRRTVTEIS
jgi:hypothetical protein